MKAVVFKGPLKVEIEERPIPKIQDPKDVILKVEYSALCGRYVTWFTETKVHMLSANDFPVVSYMSSAGISPVPRGLSWATNSLVVLKS